MGLNNHYHLHFRTLLLSLNILLLTTLITSLPILSYFILFPQVTEALPIKESYAQLTFNYYLNINTNNNNKSISLDKQLLASQQNKNIVSIVENSSNPTNKIFYDPSPITIKKGSSIIWINKDPTIHTVTSGKTDNDPTPYEFDSAMMTFNSTYIHKFDKEGTYYYHCYVHPFMTGIVNVVS